MVQYKCVSAPQHLIIEADGNFDDAVASFGDLINAQTKDGWEFHSLEVITVTKKNGCLAALLAVIGIGQARTTVNTNMLIFKKS
jgi:hypothetical protein